MHVCRCTDACSGRASCTTPCAASLLPLSLPSLSSPLRPRSPRALSGPLLSAAVPVCFCALGALLPSGHPVVLSLAAPCLSSLPYLASTPALFSLVRSVHSPICLPVLPFVPPLPLPSRSFPGTLHDTVPGTFTFPRAGHLVLVSSGHVCSPAACGTSVVGRRRGILSPAAGSPRACARTCLRGPPLTFVGSGQSHCAHVTRHAKRHAPPLPLPLPSLVACPLCNLCPLAPLCPPSLPRARYTTMCRAPAPPCAPALFAVARTVHGNPWGAPAPLLFRL